MKNLDKSTNRSILLSLLVSLFISGTVFAMAPVIKVDKVVGTVFVLEGGKTRILQAGEQLYDMAEIITGEDGLVSYRDYFDHKFHMSRSCHVKTMNRITEIKGGYLWVQSLNTKSDFSIQTSNVEAKYSKGEFIISLDNSNGKTQLLVVDGTVGFSNLLEPDLKIDVGTGHFSFVDLHHEEGIPRNQTLIGFGSFKKVISLFPGVQTLERSLLPAKNDSRFATVKKQNDSQPIRKIASTTTSATDEKRGVVTILRKDRFKLSDPLNVGSLYSKKIKRLRAKRIEKRPQFYDKKSGVKVKIFGMAGAKSVLKPISRDFFAVGSRHIAPVKVVPARGIASVITKQPVKKAPQGVIRKIVPPAPVKRSTSTLMHELSRVRAPASVSSSVGEASGNLFEKSLKKEYSKQKRHPQEMNSLIDELKNYKQDYNKKY